MTAIRIDTSAIRVATTRITTMNTVATLTTALDAARAVAHPIYAVSSGLGGLFSESTRLVLEIQGNIDALTRTVVSIAESYEATEDALTKRNTKNSLWPSVSSFLSGNPLKVSGAVVSGSVTAGGLNVSGSLLGGEASLSKQGKWDIRKGEAYTGIKGSAGAWVARGTVSADYGLAHGKADVKVGSVSAEGEARISLLDKGKLAPGLVLKGKGEATALSGKAEGRVGTDYFDVHGNAEGKIATASAEGSIRLDKEGFEVGGKAEAYLATGKVSGGLNLGLFKIDAEIEGKAGGAGVNFGAEADADSVSGTIGAGLGLGAGVKVKVDWSGAGKFINDAGTALGEVGAALSGFVQSASTVFTTGSRLFWNW